MSEHKPLPPDHQAYMMVIKLKEAKRFIDEAIRNCAEVGPIGAHCWVRNAQIELIKVAEELTAWSARRPNWQQQHPKPEDGSDA